MPTGDVTTIVAVGVIQSGCTVTEPVGTEGPAGSTLIVTTVMEEVQPEILSLAVIL